MHLVNLCEDFYWSFLSVYRSVCFGRKIAWMRTIAMDWAQFGDCNVCAVDWSRLANYAYPIAAMHHSKIVADFVVQFMIFLMKNGMDFRQVSIAGHSLGKLTD